MLKVTALFSSLFPVRPECSYSILPSFHFAEVHDQHYPRSDAEPPDLETPTRYRAGVRLVAGLTNASYYADFDSSFNKLLSKGAYDHLGGGFYNYSYDVRWPLPRTPTPDTQKRIAYVYMDLPPLLLFRQQGFRKDSV